MNDEYLTEGLGSMSDHRVLTRAITAQVKALSRLQYRGEPDKIKLMADNIITSASYLGPQFESLYTMTCGLLTDRGWIIVPRIAGGEQAWMANMSKSGRYANASQAAHRMLEGLGLGVDEYEGVLVWGADDEDRLPSLGSMPMYFEVGEFRHQGPATETFDALAQQAKRLGFDLKHTPGQFGGGGVGTGVVLRLTYGGRVKSKSGRIKGGYIGG